MSTKVVAALVAVLAFAQPLSTALAQVESAQRIAVDLATRRAQARALLCQQQMHPGSPQPSQQKPQGNMPAAALPASPPVGTGGPVFAPERCLTR